MWGGKEFHILWDTKSTRTKWKVVAWNWECEHELYKVVTFYGARTVGDPGRCIRSRRQQRSHSADRSWVSTCLQRPTQSTTRFCSSACRPSSEWKERRWPSSSLTLMAGLSMWKLVSTSQLLSSSRSVSLRGQYWDPSCSLSTPVQLLPTLQVTVFSTASMLTTRSFALRCAPTTHPQDCPF